MKAPYKGGVNGTPLDGVACRHEKVSSLSLSLSLSHSYSSYSPCFQLAIHKDQRRLVPEDVWVHFQKTYGISTYFSHSDDVCLKCKRDYDGERHKVFNLSAFLPSFLLSFPLDQNNQFFFPHFFHRSFLFFLPFPSFFPLDQSKASDEII